MARWLLTTAECVTACLPTIAKLTVLVCGVAATLSMAVVFVVALVIRVLVRVSFTDQ